MDVTAEKARHFSEAFMAKGLAEKEKSKEEKAKRKHKVKGNQVRRLSASGVALQKLSRLYRRRYRHGGIKL